MARVEKCSICNFCNWARKVLLMQSALPQCSCPKICFNANGSGAHARPNGRIAAPAATPVDCSEAKRQELRLQFANRHCNLNNLDAMQNHKCQFTFNFAFSGGCALSRLSHLAFRPQVRPRHGSTRWLTISSASRSTTCPPQTYFTRTGQQAAARRRARAKRKKPKP